MKVLYYDEFAKVKDNYRLIDVRERDEFEEVHVKGAENLPLTDLERGKRFEADDRPIAYICRSGRRSALACMQLEAEGFPEGTNIEGGTMAAIQMGQDQVVFSSKR
ncbi:MAG: rhodanese-like domain-containing protein [Myxococcales bacterium]|nr:rhodanese-like domain-containing protein [Myxococcales bacterium]MCB9644367.1 rhodanese-like domain-containing protein [Myxococcales bacterium]